MIRRFNYRIGDIEARPTTIHTGKDKTIEIVKWEGDTCYTLAFFEPGYELEHCTFLRTGIFYKDTETLMKVIRVANDFLREEHKDD